MLDSADVDDNNSVIEPPLPDLYIMINKKDIGLAYKKDAKNIYLALGMYYVLYLYQLYLFLLCFSYFF